MLVWLRESREVIKGWRDDLEEEPDFRSDFIVALATMPLMFIAAVVLHTIL